MGIRIKQVFTATTAIVLFVLSSSIAFAQNPRTLPEDTTPATADIMDIWKSSPVATKHITLSTLKTFFSADSVPTSRTITCTPPLLCDGGASMTLAANRTLSIPGVTRYFNVKDSPYNALGDNSNDDAQEIQAAIAAACAAAGGHVYLPRGIYRVSTALTITCAGVMLSGDGPGATTIRTTSTTANVISFGTAPAFAPCGGFRDISIDSSVTRTSGAAVVVDNCEYGHAENFRITTTGGNGLSLSPSAGTLSGIWSFHHFDIEISGAFTGILLNGSNDQFFSDGWIRGTSAAGSRGVTITDNGGSWWSNVDVVLFERGIEVIPGAGQSVLWVHMMNVLADNNTERGFSFVPGSGTIAGFACTACWSSSNGAASANGRGFYVGGGDGYIFASPRLVNNGGHGFEIGAASNISISSGLITGNSLSSSGLAHGIIATGTTGLRLLGNRVGQAVGASNTQGYGIFLNTGTTNYAVIGNDLRTNVTGALFDAAADAGSLIRGNLPSTVNGVEAHSGLSGLTTGDDHTQYALLAGRGSGQVLRGGLSASEILELRGTAHVTPGTVQIEDSAFIFNEAGADRDFRVESDGNANMLFVDGGANRVGIRTATPESSGLHVYSDETADACIGLGPNPDGSPGTVSAFNLCYGGATFGVGAAFINVRPTTTAGTDDPSFRIYTNNVERARFASGGDTIWKLATTTPSAALTDSVRTWVCDSAPGDANLCSLNEANIAERLTGLRKRVKTQFDKTSDTTLANVTDLTFNVEAGKSYGFSATLFTTSNVAGGVKAAIGGTATATAIIYEGELHDGGLVKARGTALGTEVCTITAATTVSCYLRGTITVNAAGTLTVQFAQNASNAAASSVLVGSQFYLEPIGN